MASTVDPVDEAIPTVKVDSPYAITTPEPNDTSTRNESSLLSSIDVLPIELLCRIFCWLRHFDDKKSGVTLHARTPPWVAILHVCSSWRTIALECKLLWSIIPLGHPRWTEMALRLSEPVDVALWIPGGRLFLHTAEHSTVDDELLDEAFALTIPHLARIRRLELHMHPYESRREEDWLGDLAFLRARTLLAPLCNERMDKLYALTCSGADLISGSFFGGDWFHHARVLSLSFCRFTQNLDLLALPLVKLTLFMPDFGGSFPDLMLVLSNLRNLKHLSITDLLNTERYAELFGPEGLSSRLPRVGLPNLKTLTLMGSPLLMAVYLSQFDVPREVVVAVMWWAAHYKVPDAAIPEQMLRAKWPLAEQLGFEPTDEERISWLSDLCAALIRYIYTSIAAAPSTHAHFGPSSFDVHPRVHELERGTPITLNSIEWHPEHSVIRFMGGEGAQATSRAVFGVTTAIREVSEWNPIIESLRMRGERDAYSDPGRYTTPAAFTFKAPPHESDGLGGPIDHSPLTLIALDCIDLTTPYMKIYFPVMKHLLQQWILSKTGMQFSVSMLFPFGLEVSDEQREDLREFNVGVSDYSDAGYPYADFY